MLSIIILFLTICLYAFLLITSWIWIPTYFIIKGLKACWKTFKGTFITPLKTSKNLKGYIKVLKLEKINKQMKVLIEKDILDRVVNNQTNINISKSYLLQENGKYIKLTKKLNNL